MISPKHKRHSVKKSPHRPKKRVIRKRMKNAQKDPVYILKTKLENALKNYHHKRYKKNIEGQVKVLMDMYDKKEMDAEGVSMILQGRLNEVREAKKKGERD